jgi:hypothetical protein
MRPRPRRGFTLLAGLLVVTACSTSASSSAPASSQLGEASPTASVAPTPRATVQADPLVRPVIDGAFDVGDGRKLYLQCWGEGSPTIVIDAGGGEIQEYRDYAATFSSRLAQQRRVCAYDRAGHGRSDPAPNKPRQLEDLTGDLHALLAAAGVEGPLVLVGNSFGGFDMAFYANRYSEDVAGVVLLDVPAPSATMTQEDEPELAWDNPGNVEHNDVVAGFENRLAEKQFPFDAPLLVVTGSQGQSSVKDQKFWLDWSPSSRQIELDGGHELHVDQAVAAADAVLSMAEQS